MVATATKAEQLISELGTHPVASMAYATAVVAGLRTDDTTRLFPAAVEWRRHRQHSDGPWGEAAFHPQDRLVSTLAAVLAL